MTTTTRRAPVQELRIPDWLPPDVANRSRQRHWTTVRREIAAVHQTVWYFAHEAGWHYVGDDAPKQALTVVLVFPNKRRRDIDNLVARCKHLIDGLKPFLIDDDSEHLELVVKAEVQPGCKETRLRLESLMPDLGRDGGEGSSG